MAHLFNIFSIGLLCVYLCGSQTWGYCDQSQLCCDRTLLGRSGVVASPNFPLDYGEKHDCTYKHYFQEFEEEEVKEICFQFRRFDLDDLYGVDYLTINGTHYRGRGESSMANLCVPATESTFELRFLAGSVWIPSRGHPGFYANYYVKTEATNTSVTPSAPPSEQENVFCNSPDLFLCFDGKKCISSDLQCDGEFDCDDKSDEAYATARCEGADGQTMYQAVNVTSLPLNLADYGLSSNYDGVWVAERRSSVIGYGPSGPHVSGYYLRTNFSNTYSSTVDTVKLTYKMDGYEKELGEIPYCLTFWYHMNGKDAGQLDVSWGAYPAWTRVGDYKNRWYKAEIQKLLEYNYDVVFSATRGAEKRTQIAIQDISLMPGPCHTNSDYQLADDLSCGFHMDMCGWGNSADWERDRTNHEDPTEGPNRAAQGLWYLKPSSSSSLTLTSPFLTKQRDFGCLILKAYSTEFNNRMYVGQRGGYETIVEINRSNEWEIYKLSIETFYQSEPTSVKLRFEKEGIFLDDFVYAEVPCQYIDIEKCEVREYMCSYTFDCLRSALVCNGERDCDYGDDEQNYESCKGGAHLCGNKECISYSKRCDGQLDCYDDSDEENCESCKDGAFLCDNRQCVAPWSQCDGIWQCRDGSDEWNCAITPPEPTLNGGQIAGIVVGCLLGVSLVVSVIAVVSRKQKGSPRSQPPMPNVSGQSNNGLQPGYPAQPVYPAQPGYPAQPPPQVIMLPQSAYQTAVANQGFQPTYILSVPNNKAGNTGNFVQVANPTK